MFSKMEIKEQEDEDEVDLVESNSKLSSNTIFGPSLASHKELVNRFQKKNLSQHERQYLFDAKQRTKFDLDFLWKCKNLFNFPIFKKFVDVLKCWNKQISKNPKKQHITYKQTICKEIYRILRRAAVLDNAQAIKQLQYNYLILKVHLQQNSDPQYEIKMPHVIVEDRFKIKRSKTQHQNSQLATSLKKIRINSLAKSRCNSNQDIGKFQFLSYKRKMHELELKKQIEQIRNIQDSYDRRKIRMNEERLKLDRVIKGKSQDKQNENRYASIISEIDEKKDKKVESIEGLKLIKLNPQIFLAKNKQNKSCKTGYEWKFRNKPEKKTKKLIIY